MLDSEIHEHHINNKPNEKIAFDHKLYALGEDMNGNVALYKITVEEYFQSKTEPDKKRFHNLRYVKKVADVPGRRTFSHDVNSGGSAMDNSSTTTYNVSDLYSLVKKYDKEFKLNDAPFLAGHSTNRIRYIGVNFHLNISADANIITVSF